MDDRAKANLLLALESGGYDAKPSKLRQGCIMLAPKGDGTEYSEKELDVIWANTFGYNNPCYYCTGGQHCGSCTCCTWSDTR